MVSAPLNFCRPYAYVLKLPFIYRRILSGKKNKTFKQRIESFAALNSRAKGLSKLRDSIDELGTLFCGNSVKMACSVTRRNAGSFKILSSRSSVTFQPLASQQALNSRNQHSKSPLSNRPGKILKDIITPV